VTTDSTRRYVPDPRYSVGPMQELYDLVFERLEQHGYGENLDSFSAWLRATRPTVGHLAIMMLDMALSGQPMGGKPVTLFGFRADGEPIVG